ncbi:MAG: hypothetical protein AAF485_19730, partial [Chloroflexota bacterium]
FLQNNLVGLSLSLIFMFFALSSPLSTSIASGLQRGFAIPLLIIFLYYIIRQQFVGAAIAIFLSAIIYFPNFPLLVVTYSLTLVKVTSPFKISLDFSKAKLWPFVAALVASSGFLALAVAAQQRLLPVVPSPPLPDPIKPEVSTNLYLSLKGGPTPLFENTFLLGRAGLFDTGGDVANFLTMFLLAFLVYRVLGRQSFQKVPPVIWRFLIASGVMYIASFLVLIQFSSFVLYLPSRYTRSTFFLSILFFIGLNWSDFLIALPRWGWRNRRLIAFFFCSFLLSVTGVYLFSANRALLLPTLWFLGLLLSGSFTLLGGSWLFWLAVTGRWFEAFRRKPDNTDRRSFIKIITPFHKFQRLILILLIGLAIGYLGTTYITIIGLKPIDPSRDERNIYEFVAMLPKDAILAGKPALMTNIPLFSKRAVLFRGLFPEISSPFIEYFDAHYAEHSQKIVDFCEKYRVDYLVFDRKDFRADYLARQQFFPDPWNSVIVDTVAGRSQFALLQTQPLFTSGPFSVIKCDNEMFSTNNLD